MDGVSPHHTYHVESSALVNVSLERHRKKKKEDENDPKHAEVDSPPRLSCEDFTVEFGKEQIETLIETWGGVRSCWRHSLDFLYVTELEHCGVFHYRARFSAPTARQPISQTASVFFGVEVSKFAPRATPLEVHFVVESNRLVNTSGKHRFRETWLTDVIDCKKRLGAEADL